MKIKCIIFVASFFISTISLYASNDIIDDIQILINKYGKTQIGRYIINKRGGKITIQDDRRLKTTIGLPHKNYITVYSIKYDLNLLNLTPQEADTLIDKFIKVSKRRRELIEKDERERQERVELEKKLLEEKKKQEELRKKEQEEKEKNEFIQIVQELKQKAVGQVVWVNEDRGRYLLFNKDLEHDQFPDEGEYIILELFDKLTVEDVDYSIKKNGEHKIYIKVKKSQKNGEDIVGYIPLWRFTYDDHFFVRNPREIFSDADEKIWQKALDGKIAIGMSEDLAVIILGKPDKINKEVNASGVLKQYVYDYGKYVYFKDGTLVSWQENR